MSQDFIRFGEMIDYCHILPSFEDLEQLLDDFSVSDKNKRQLLSDLKEGFLGIKRKDGSPYLEHLIHTLRNARKYNSKDMSEDDVIIALLHDSIEDTKETYQSIRQKYGDTVALGVHILSKPDFQDFHDENEFQEIQIVMEKECGIEITHASRLKNTPIVNEIGRKKWGEYEKKVKKRRDDTYFNRFLSLEYLQQALINEGQKLGVSLDSKTLKRLSKKIAIIKLSDRLHNIQTLPEGDEAEKKILETTTYFKDIGIKHFPDIWEKIGKEIVKHYSRKNIPRKVRRILPK